MAQSGLGPGRYRDLSATIYSALSEPPRSATDQEVTPKTIDTAITGSRDGAVLIAVADYHLSNDGSQLAITANVDLYGNSAALAPFRPAKGSPDRPSDPSNSLYRDSFVFDADLPGPPAKREINMVAWTANNAAAFRSAMKL